VRVLVVDDSAFMRTALSRMIHADPELEVVDTARNGEDAIEKVRRLKPDLVTLDIEMPVMSGLDALPEILRAGPAVLMCSSLTTRGSKEALEALKLGAADFIAKDCSFASAEITKIEGALRDKLKAIGRSRGARSASARRGVVRTSKPLDLAGAAFDLIVIGSSTGGPPVLEEILTSLPPDLPAPVVIAQHMPAIFTKSMAQRLGERCAVTVVHADGSLPLLPGCVYVIQGGTHGFVRRAGAGKHVLDIRDKPAEALYKPSVDVLFDSAAVAARSRCLAVVLTGMGEDGAIGGRAIRDAGGRLIAQDAESCVVYGMPRAVAESGVAEAALPPSAIALTLAQLARATAPPLRHVG
jgi:two-component system chemotaxis response regulator CheB